MKVASSILLAALLASATPARARTFVVDQSGGGDFTTIQAAIDTVDTRNAPDTVVVHAGHYAEHLNFRLTTRFPNRTVPLLLLCPSGPDSTTALDFTNTRNEYWFADCWWLGRGLGFVSRCVPVPGFGGPFPLRWEQCKFFGGYDATSYGCQRGEVADCDFYASTRLIGYNTTFENLRFHRAPLVTMKECGTLLYSHCSFVGGPTDTLLYSIGGEDMVFRDCSFDSGGVGMNLSAFDCCGPLVERCAFRDLDIGVLVRPHSAKNWSAYIQASRFERCDQAVVSLLGDLDLVGDTIIDCREGVVLPSPWGTLDGMVFDRITGTALEMTTPAVLSTENGTALLTNSTFRNVGGTGARIRRFPAASGENAVQLRDNRFEDCDTAAVVLASRVALQRNVAFANDGAGFVMTLTSSTGTDSIAYNTCAFNLGNGISLSTTAASWPAAVRVVRNVSAQNGGDGFRIGAGYTGTFANNDAWQNYGAEYAGVTPGATNVSLDPKFCDLVNGDLTLSAGSPFAPGSAFGWAGAYGVGCDQALLDAPPLADAASLAVRPNPARGVVTFALPGRAATGALEVLDVQGRRVWRTPIDAGATNVQWRGEREGGTRAGAGIYWVRVQRGATTTQTKRFIWLE